MSCVFLSLGCHFHVIECLITHAAALKSMPLVYLGASKRVIQNFYWGGGPGARSHGPMGQGLEPGPRGPWAIMGLERWAPVGPRPIGPCGPCIPGPGIGLGPAWALGHRRWEWWSGESAANTGVKTGVNKLEKTVCPTNGAVKK